MPTVINAATGVINWDGFSELPKGNLDLLLDVTALNKKLADKRNSPYRWRTGSFQVPIAITSEMLKKVCKDKIDKWLTVFEKQGWQLASKVQVYPGHNPYFDIKLGVPILDRKEICVRAIFKTNPKPLKIFIPPSSVRHSKEQTATLAEVMKGEGIKPVPIKERNVKSPLRERR